MTLNIETGLTTTPTTKTKTTTAAATKVLRCYGCVDPDIEPQFLKSDKGLPKDPPKCSDDGYGKEFDCSGDALGILEPLCAKVENNGKSDFFFNLGIHHLCF